MSSDRNVDAARNLDRICQDFEAEWRAGHRPRIEQFLTTDTNVERRALLNELLALEVELRADRDETIVVEELHHRFPEDLSTINEFCEDIQQSSEGGQFIGVRCAACRHVNQLLGTLRRRLFCSACGEPVTVAATSVESIRAAVGLPAPVFTMPCTGLATSLVESVSLSDFRGRWVALVFYPRDFSLVCPTELTAFDEHIEDFRQFNCEVLAVSIDTIESHCRWLRTPVRDGGLLGLGFSLASDETTEVAQAYGVYDHGGHCTLRGLFIIDPEGILQYQVVHNHNVGRGTEEPLRVLAALKSGGLCQAGWGEGQDHVSTTELLTPGRVISHYQIEQQIGSGAFGTVYRANDMILQRPVALKVLDPHTMRASRTSLTEARVAAALNHPNVCTVYAIDDTVGVPVIAMECLSGITLTARLKALRLTKDEVADIAVQFARGLAAAHEKGIGHGDLKPGNLMLTVDGTVKILDFGLACVAVPGTDPQPTEIAGTPAYMAPEQTTGTPASPASDVFSFGLILYEMLTGTRAVDARGIAEQLSQVRSIDAETLADSVDAQFSTILKQLLSPDPQSRPGMTEVLKCLN